MQARIALTGGERAAGPIGEAGMRGTPKVRRFAILALASLLTATVVGGCSTPPHREIEAIGVVASQSSGFDGNDTVHTYRLVDGRTFSLRYKGHIATGGPATGDLLIGGTHPDNWVLGARPGDPSFGCPTSGFALGGMAGYDTATTVEFDFGVALQKAPDFNPTGHGTLGPFGDRGIVCPDRQGRVTQINA
jgi:hypothetical protein